MGFSSRDTAYLANDVRPLVEEFIARCKANQWLSYTGISVLITCTFRDEACQEELYAQGRTKPGRIVTWARAGQSMHNKRSSDGTPAARAVDIVPLRHGKPIWGTKGDGIDNDPSDDERDDLEAWQRVAEIGKSVGLEWAGEWSKGKREFPHFQKP